MTLPGQMELATVINHQQLIHDLENGSAIPFLRAHEDAHKPAGVRLAKMLSMYEDSPSSQLWSDIQSLASEILKA